MPYPPDVAERLTSIYEELMWLAHRPHVTPRQARAWYSQVLATALAPKLRQFSGRVSEGAAAAPSEKLVLEHYNRLSHSLSRLIEGHVQQNLTDPYSFLSLIERCERVNIATDEENHDLQATQGDYAAAGIRLVEWNDLPVDTRDFLWQTKLRGKVCNAADFRVAAIVNATGP